MFQKLKNVKKNTFFIKIIKNVKMFLHLWFRNHSTETAVINIYNNIVMALDTGFSTAQLLLLLDFSAAFDCVDHSILLKVLKLQFGITASALQWISSFLAS